MRPYWTNSDGSIVIYHSTCEAVLAAGLVPVRDVALCHCDPPYGVNEATDRATRGRGDRQRARTSTLPGGGRIRDFSPVHGDDRPFDPAPLLVLDRPTVLWGANHYSDKVPGSPSWITWDKREDQGSDDNADCEHAWSNLGGPARIFRHWWRGALRKTEKEDRHLHPTQKPIALSTYVFHRAKLKRGDLVFVPYLGSGPDLPAAQAMGLRIVACDVEEWCCRTAVGRLGAITPEEAAKPVGPLFGGER